jgi:hypothetical protein
MTTCDSEDLEEKWPHPSDQLFQPGSRRHNGHVLTDPSERFYRMPQGYMRAADLLVAQALLDDSDRKNILYPALFCYRQSVELYLKQLVTDFGPSAEAVEKARRKPNSSPDHNLAGLWREFKAILRDRGNTDVLGMQPMETLIQELHNADSRSDGFRYPTMKDGRPFAFGNREIDLERLRQSMHGIQNFFECADMAMTHEDNVASELVQDLGAWE